MTGESPEFSPLSSPLLQSLLTTKHFGRQLHVFDDIPSTNAYALELAESGAHHGAVVLAEGQTAGRGRLRRQWFSPKGTNIYCSVVLRHKPPTHALSWIPLVTGLAIVDTVERHSNLSVSLKWPNDVVMNDKKLGGVLCESTQQSQYGWAVAVGIGINVNLTMDALPLELRESATSLMIEGQGIQDRHSLVATLLSQLEIWQDALVGSDIAQLRSVYRSRCSSLGRQVQLHCMDGHILKGTALDINNEGALQIIPSTCATTQRNDASSTIDVHAGDVVHVR